MRPKETRAFVILVLMSYCIFELVKTLRNILFQNLIAGESFDNTFFSFTYVTNSGSAWGFWQGGTWFFIIFAILFILFILIYVWRNLNFNDRFEIIFLSMLLGGVLGNLSERITKGYVADFIKLNYIDFPVFNFYDILICTGISLLFCNILQKSILEKLACKKK